MATGLIGALRVTLGIDASEFESGTKKAQAEMRAFQREFKRTAKTFQTAGENLTKYMTVPILGVGAAMMKMAGDFEAAMIEVKVASNASAEQMARMSDLAKEIGANTIFSAKEAASGMAMLSKAGIDTETILSGAAKAVADLAAAAGSELDPAASAISDAINQFKVEAKDLPMVVNTITGAVNESKLDFEDFTYAMGQAGGVAGVNVKSFEEFATAIAGISPLFASGQDAGTSFKTFLMSMTPDTKKAKEAMSEYSLEFYDAQGNMRSLADIAEQLQQKFGKLSDEDRNAVFKKLFGQDAIRAAIGLMQMGGEGFEKMQKKIQATDASAQAAERMKGFNASMEKLKGAFENLAIAVGESGMLEAITKLIEKITEWIDWMSEASPATLKWITVLAGVGAALGPVLLVIGSLIKGIGLALPLLMKLAPVFQGIATALGYLAPVLLGVGKYLIAGILAHPVLAGAAALLTGIYLAWKHWDQIGPIVQRLYTQVKTWMMDKLSGVFTWLDEKIKSVTGWFYDMYDAVVGHSYVPDMVDGIAAHIRRLQNEMVEPVKKNAEAVKQAFLQMKQSVLSVVERLFPEEARYTQYINELKLITENMQKLGFTAEQAASAVAALGKEFERDVFGEQEPGWWEKKTPGADEEGGPIADTDNAMDELEKSADLTLNQIGDLTKSKTAEMAQAWADMAKRAIGSVKGMVDAFKSGDIAGGLQSLLDLVVNVIGMLSKIGVLGGQSGGIGIPSNAGSPGFSTGGSFMVGGSGGVDSQLVQFRATPGEQVRVDRRGDQGRREPVMVVVTKGEMFDAHVERVAKPMVEDGVQRGAVGGAGLAAQQQHRARRGALA